jgi:hypothetical protein
MIIISSSLNAFDIGYWKDLRFSAKLSDGNVRLQTELNRTNLTSNKVLYSSGTAISEYDVSLINPATSTYQAQIPMGTESKYIGLKHATSTSGNHLAPVYYSGTAMPALSNLSKLSADASSDQSTNHLDIISDYVSFSDTKLYTAIQNRGGGFPTSGSFGTVYFSYMSVIANPESDPQDPNTIVWALNYMNVSLGGISPGLYKITGTGTSDLIRIGNIQTQVVSGSNLLIMSCNLADLMADPDFAAWYNPTNPVFGMQTIINRTTVIPFATTTSDTSPGGIVYPTQLIASPWDYSASSLTGLELVIQPDDLYFKTNYSNPNNLFSVSTVLSLPGGVQYPMFGSGHSYAQGVQYRTANLSGTLTEADNAEALALAGELGASLVQSSPYTYSYILGLRQPEVIITQYDEQYHLLSWSPVTQTLLGNPVTISRYCVEASSDPMFESFETLGETDGNSYLAPINPLNARQFYRIIAIKALP